MTQNIVMALDLGTTSVKAAVVDDKGTMLTKCSTPAPALDHNGCFDADIYFDATAAIISDIVASEPKLASKILGISISSQRATMVPLDDTGETIADAQSWLSTDCAITNDEFIERFGKERFSQITGLVPSPIYTLAKMLHFRKTTETRSACASRFALMHDFVLHKLGAGQFFVDPSNASATGLFDVHQGRWSPAITDDLALEECNLPKIQYAGTVAGATSRIIEERTGLPHGIPLIVGGGDQQCAALGAGAFSPYCGVISTGTASSVLVPIENQLKEPPPGLLNSTHIIPGLGLLEGFQSSFGSSTNWAADFLGLEDVETLEKLARKSEIGARGVIFYPFLSGIGSPDFKPLARATVSGLTNEARREDFARAVFEGIAMEIRRIVETIEEYTTMNTLRIAGGMSHSSLLGDILAQFCSRDLEVSEVNEAALIGAAAAAFYGIGHFPSITDAAKSMDQGTRRVEAGAYDQTALNALYATYVDGVATIKKQAAQNIREAPVS